MGRGVSCGGGRSSLGYLFGSGETANKAAEVSHKQEKEANSDSSSQKNIAASPSTNNNAAEVSPKLEKDAHSNSSTQKNAVSESNEKQIPAGGRLGSHTNNYFRADGQNCGNFLTDRPSTKVHSAPGGGSSLGYLFGSGGN